MNFPAMEERWSNPRWQPKFWGGKRMPRKLKKRFRENGFDWKRPECFPQRWLRNTYTYPNLLPYLTVANRYKWGWPDPAWVAWDEWMREHVWEPEFDRWCAEMDALLLSSGPLPWVNTRP
jgi:hypothetical protein